MSTRSWKYVVMLVLFVLCAAPDAAQAQLGKRLKERAKQQAAEKAANKAVEKVMGSEESEPSVPEEAEEAAPAAQAQEPEEAGADEAPLPAQKPGEGAWLNYDFVPGERILFADDFTNDRVGDFPRRFEFREGNMEIAEWQGQRFLRATAWGGFAIVLPDVLPERFTLEFDAAVPSGWAQEIHFMEEAASYVEIWPEEGGIDGETRAVSYAANQPGPGVLFPFKVMVDGSYVKVYHNGTRVANVPNANLGRSNTIVFKIAASQDNPVFYGNFRIGAGGLDLYDALASEGRVATQGILFDTGSDQIRPESTPTLKEIGQMLQQYPDLRIAIEGHTDATGNADANQRLSEQRAAAVKAYLMEAYSIDADRLEAFGYGPSKPAADNATPEGRQQNRRVELVRL